tara:strand:+ start:8658 stop:8915 length:258 start_codon:yes stop_codon:yes gene_type:complete
VATIESELTGSDDLILKVQETIVETPEEWAADMSGRACEIAKGLIEKGVTKALLLQWRQDRKDRVLELLQDRIDALLQNETQAKG